ncbi:2-oxoglutarate (2OG) and Fe(II)-dependent oxygenase superfamily protein [Actinidia rufa]|uniref:2-oxoglutarate (2OG) and Fe(II)-dependent oxygenase superfamily protein n=1 Tax=Actinidia rufa TaxID=165716 RepID=A0A7J0DTM6_9ERIC|nr:2-oxoglutarate (2OG) and Fe(II)-dependent oxygenase superfamily protein [Actinidia rufa]
MPMPGGLHAIIFHFSILLHRHRGEKANAFSENLRSDQTTATGKIQDGLQYLSYVVLSISMLLLEVINHGVPLDCREKIESASGKFFTQSLEEKSKVRRGELNPMGYYDREHTKNDDVGALEVKQKTDGEWIRVKPTPDAYIVNVGDIIQVWSNDKYECVEHRVMVNNERERFSIPFFFNSAHPTMVKPLEELLNHQNHHASLQLGKAAGNLSNFKKLNVENNNRLVLENFQK